VYRQSFYICNLGRKTRRLIATCDICQRVKHPNRSTETEERSHLPEQPADLCAIDIYGSLPAGRGGVKYILVCFDVFSKHIKLYPIKAAITKSCLSRLVNDYFTDVRKPKVILSDNGTQFQSPVWKRMMQQHGVEVRFSAIRHPRHHHAAALVQRVSSHQSSWDVQTHTASPSVVFHLKSSTIHYSRRIWLRLVIGGTYSRPDRSSVRSLIIHGEPGPTPGYNSAVFLVSEVGSTSSP
jgi:hypothetical protein